MRWRHDKHFVNYKATHTVHVCTHAVRCHRVPTICVKLGIAGGETPRHTSSQSSSQLLLVTAMASIFKMFFGAEVKRLNGGGSDFCCLGLTWKKGEGLLLTTI